MGFVRLVDGRRARGFGEAVGLDDREAQAVQILAHGRIELGAAGDEQPHVAAEHLVHLAEHRGADVDAGLAQHQVGAHQAAEHLLLQPSALVDLGGDLLVNQIEELRHAREDRDAPLGQGLEQVGGVERFEEDHARAHGKRQQQVGHLRERMEERQHAQHGVALRHVDHGKGRLALAGEVAVREHHALGVGGGARGVENHRGVSAAGWARRKRHLGARRAQHPVDRLARVVARPVHAHERKGRGGPGGRHRLLCHRQQAGAGHEQPGTRGREHGRDLRGRVVGVERHGHGADAQHGQVDGAPARVVVGQNRAAIARRHPLRDEPSGDGVGHVPKIAIGDLLQARRPLHLDRHVGGKPGGGRVEDVPEVLHAGEIVGQPGSTAVTIGAGASGAWWPPPPRSRRAATPRPRRSRPGAAAPLRRRG